MNVLDEIVADTRVALAERRRERPLAELLAAAQERIAGGGARRVRCAPRSRAPGISVIAEHKRRSPSAGLIRGDVSLEQVVAAYERGGARALSVLTEESRFGGSLADLRAARRRERAADPAQGLHRRSLPGARGARRGRGRDPADRRRACHADQLTELLELAGELGLAALVEVHDRPELAWPPRSGAELIGINNRDLTTLEVDTRRTFELLEHVPPGAVVSPSPACERGRSSTSWPAGVDAVLIGEALMRAADIEAACRELTVL